MGDNLEFSFVDGGRTGMPPPKLMPAKPTFKNSKYYKEYLHDEQELDEAKERAQQLGLEMNDEAIHYWSGAFYEIELECEVDLDTGDVRVWGVQGVPLQDPVIV